MKDLNTSIGEKKDNGTMRKKRVSTRALGTNPRAKGTNKRAKATAMAIPTVGETDATPTQAKTAKIWTKRESKSSTRGADRV